MDFACDRFKRVPASIITGIWSMISRVDAGIDEVYGHTGHLHTVFIGISDAVPALEARQQGRMDIDDTAFEPLNEGADRIRMYPASSI